MKKKKKNKYWLCEFFKRYGEEEQSHYYIYSDKNISDMKYTGEDDEHIILSHFFFNKLTPDNQDGNAYWHLDSLVEFRGMEEVKPSEFKTLQKAGVYVNGDNLTFNYDKGECL